MSFCSGSLILARRTDYELYFFKSRRFSCFATIVETTASPVTFAQRAVQSIKNFTILKFNIIIYEIEVNKMKKIVFATIPMQKITPQHYVSEENKSIEYEGKVRFPINAVLAKTLAKDDEVKVVRIVTKSEFADISHIVYGAIERLNKFFAPLQEQLKDFR